MNPLLSPERQQYLEEVLRAYLEAIDQGLPVDRQDLLRRHPDLAADLEKFFAEEDKFDRLARPLRPIAQAARIDAGDTTTGAATLPEAPGLCPGTKPRAFGDYELLEKIASGGMGIVYKARQRAPNRLVAFKMIMAGSWATKADIQRFRNEAETAAQLDHPHIVPIYEVGEHEGHFYFSMKLFEGGSLGQWVNPARPLATDKDTSRRVGQLMAAVARAVHHAHQHGVLHRDLKPGNILLDSLGEPHVTDFGLAKHLRPTEQEPNAASLTQSGALIGTPSYMAPEQVRSKQGAVTIATDVYGLGAILYALLAGRPPFRGDTFLDTLDQVQKRDPDRPSRSNPAADRDLETICLKCLQKEPQRRYASAEALAEDLERWLAGEPIQARPVKRIERLWRWCRRKPALATAGGISIAAVVALALSSIFIWLGWSEARWQRDLADAQRRRADVHFQEARDAVDEMLTKVGDKRLADIPQMTQLRTELLEKALEFYERFVEEESKDPSARQELGKAYLRIGELQNNLGRQGKAGEAFQNGQAVFEQLTTDFPDRADYWLDLARCYEGPAWAALDDPQKGELACRRALEVRERLAREHPGEPRYQNDLAKNYLSLGRWLAENGKFEAVEPLFHQGLDQAEKLVAEQPDIADCRSTLSEALESLGKRLLDAGRYPEAEPLLRRALAHQEKLAQEFPDNYGYRVTLGFWHWNLAQLLEKIGQAPEAEQAYRSALAIHDRLAVDFPGLPVNKAHAATIRGGTFGTFLFLQGRFEEAECAFREALASYEKLAAEYPTGILHKLARVNQGQTYAGLGQMFLQIGRRDEAKEIYSRMEIVCRKAAEDFPDVAINRDNLADCLHKQGELLQIDGRLAEAEKMFLQSLAVQEKVVAEWPTIPLYHDGLAIVHLRLAFARSLAGRPAEAESDFHKAVAFWDKLIADSPADSRYRQELSLFLAEFPDEKLRDPRRAEELILPVLKQQPQSGMAWLTLGIARCRLGKWKPAVEALNKAVELRNGGDSNEWFYLAMAQEHLGEKEQARKSYDRAVQWMEKNRPKDPELGHLRTEVQGQLK